MTDFQRYFKTGKRMQIAFDNADRIDGMEELLDTWFAEHMEIDLSGDITPDVPYWLTECAIDARCWTGHTLRISEDRWDPCISAPVLHASDLRDVDLYCQYVPGCYEPHRIGQILYVDGGPYVYIGAESLPEEYEHQAEDGGLAYHYRGYSYLRMLVLLEDIQDALEYPGGKPDEIDASTDTLDYWMDAK